MKTHMHTLEHAVTQLLQKMMMMMVMIIMIIMMMIMMMTMLVMLVVMMEMVVAFHLFVEPLGKRMIYMWIHGDRSHGTHRAAY